MPVTPGRPGPAAPPGSLATDAELAAAIAAAVPTVSVADYGAVGDGSHDDTAAITAAITDAGREAQVYLPTPTSYYRITDAIPVPYAGLRIFGQSAAYTKIQQVTADANIFELAGDTTYLGSTYGAFMEISGLRLVGPGTGTGVGIWTDDGGATYLGQELILDRLRVESFDVGIQLYNFDNSDVRNLVLKSCRIGYKSGGNANTLHLTNVGASTCSEVAFSFGAGRGVVFQPADIVNSVQAILCGSSSQVTILGGNLEGCTGSTAFIDVAANANVSIRGTRFLKGSGNDVNRIRAAAATVDVGPVSESGFGTGTVTVYKSSDTGNVTVRRGLEDDTTQGYLVSESGSVGVGHAPLPTRRSSALPAAAAANRGRVLFSLSEDNSTTPDQLYAYIGDGTGGYSRRILSAIIYGSGTPEASVTAKVGTAYLDYANGTAYLKETGSGNTGWSKVQTAQTIQTYLYVGDGTAAGGTAQANIIRNDTYAGQLLRVEQKGAGTAGTAVAAIIADGTTTTASALFARSKGTGDIAQFHSAAGSVLGISLNRITAAKPIQLPSYTTAGRPAANGASAGAGAVIYDTTLSMPVWSDGSVWKDAAGNTV